MGSQNACMWGCISQKAAPRLLRAREVRATISRKLCSSILYLFITSLLQFDVAHGQALLYLGHHHVLQGKGIDLQNVVLLHLDLTPVCCCTWSGSALCGPPPSPPHQSVTNIFEYSNIRIYWSQIYIRISVRINFSFTNIFGHSFVSDEYSYIRAIFNTNIY